MEENYDVYNYDIFLDSPHHSTGNLIAESPDADVFSGPRQYLEYHKEWADQVHHDQHDPRDQQGQHSTLFESPRISLLNHLCTFITNVYILIKKIITNFYTLIKDIVAGVYLTVKDVYS